MFLKGNQLVEGKNARALFVFCTRGAAEKQQSKFCPSVRQFERVLSAKPKRMVASFVIEW